MRRNVVKNMLLDLCFDRQAGACKYYVMHIQRFVLYNWASKRAKYFNLIFKD